MRAVMYHDLSIGLVLGQLWTVAVYLGVVLGQ